MKTRVCSKCYKRKRVKSFRKRTDRRTVDSICKRCQHEVYKLWRASPEGRILYKAQIKRNNDRRLENDTPEMKLIRNARQRENRRRNPEKFRGYELKKAYGITLIEWKDIFRKQGRVCAICKCHRPNIKAHWHTDHDHKTGRIRGILCGKCNTALGYMKDSIKALSAAIAYLIKFSEEA